MNWMGGARNRIKLQEEKKRQKEFFSRKRQSNQLNINRPTDNRANKKVCSQDLLLFETIEKIFNDIQPKNNSTDPKKKVPHAELKERVVKFNTPKLPISPSYFPSVLNSDPNDNCVEDHQPQQQITSTLLKNWCIKLNNHFEKENTSEQLQPTGKLPSNKSNTAKVANEPEIATKTQQPNISRRPEKEMETFLIQNVVNYQASTSKKSTSEVYSSAEAKSCNHDAITHEETSRFSTVPKMNNIIELDGDWLCDIGSGKLQHPSNETEESCSTIKENDSDQVSSVATDDVAVPDPTGYQKTYVLWQKSQNKELCSQLEYGRPVTTYFHNDSECDLILDDIPSPPSETARLEEIQCAIDNGLDGCDISEETIPSCQSVSEEILHDPNLGVVDKMTQADMVFQPLSSSEICEVGIQTENLCCNCKCNVQMIILLE